MDSEDILRHVLLMSSHIKSRERGSINSYQVRRVRDRERHTHTQEERKSESQSESEREGQKDRETNR